MTTQFLRTSEGTIAYDDVGSGQLVLCVPGMGDLRQEYRLLGPRLVAAGYRVVTMDVRGHGESGLGWVDYSNIGVGRDMLALISHLNAGSAIIAGNSMAAGAAVYAATEQPEQVAGIMLLGPFVRNPPPSAFMNLMMKMLFAQPWGAWSWGMYFSSLFPTYKPADFAAYRQKLVANLREPGRLASLRKMIFSPKDVSESRAGKVTVPTLIVMGTKDPDFKDPIAEANWLASQTHGKVILVDGAGHYPHVEMIDQVAQPIIDFMKSIEVTHDS